MANRCALLTRSFFAGGLAVGEDGLRFLEFFELVGNFSPTPSWRKLSLRGVPVLAIAARERIMSVWAAMLMLFSLPASLAGLQVGTSGVLGGISCLGVPSPSLPFFCREGVLGQSADSSWLQPDPEVRERQMSELAAPGLLTGVEGELRPWMSCSITAACLAREMVFEGAFVAWDWGLDVGWVTAGGLKSLDAEDEGVNCCCCSCMLPLISFSLLAVTFGISWEGVLFSVRPSHDLAGAFSASSFLLVSSFSFLVPDFSAESEGNELELWESLAFAPSPSLSWLCFLSADFDLFPDSDFFKASGFEASPLLALALCAGSWLWMLWSCLREFLLTGSFWCCCGGMGFSAFFTKPPSVWGSAEHLTVCTLLLALLPPKIVGFVRVAGCILSFSVCRTVPDVAGDEVVPVVLAVCGWTSEGVSKHKILLCLGAFAESCWPVFSADTGWTNLLARCCSVPGIQKNMVKEVRQWHHLVIYTMRILISI